MNATDFIAEFEGCARVGDDGLIYPYLDAVGVPTQGYGHVVQNMDQAPWTPDQAKEVLAQDVAASQATALRMSPTLGDFPDRLTAITSFVFNLGAHAYDGSTLHKCVDAGEWFQASQECLRWNHAGGKVLAGLTSRRKAESALLWTSQQGEIP